MKTPTYLDEKGQVVILRSDEIVNRSQSVLKDDLIEVSETDALFIYLEDYERKSLRINLTSKSKTTIYMIFKTSKPNEYDIQINLENRAQADVFSVFRNVEKTNLTVNRRFVLAESANLNIRNALLNMGETTLNELVSLSGVKAEVAIDVLNIGAYNDVFTVNQDVSHQAKSTISNITNSLISNQNAKLNYSVSGRILKGNEFSSCKQTNKGIILNEAGEIGVIPKLYIDEYNVEASHGAAIGQIDEEQLYYLLSRGLTEAEARSLIISGYTKPFVAAIGDEDIKELVERQILKRINEADIL